MVNQICLNMIVGNEAKNIEKCLENVHKFINAACIDFNGDDESQDLARKWLKAKEIPYCFRKRKWYKDFGRSRSEVLRQTEKYTGLYAKEPNEPEDLNGEKEAEVYGKIDTSAGWYAMFMDVDNDVQGVKLDVKNLNGDTIVINMNNVGATYDYVWMIKLSKGKRWKWEYPVHEVLMTIDGTPHKAQRLKEGYINSGRTGARNLVDPKTKYLGDAEVIVAWLKTHQGEKRMTYYAAQSYKDAGEWAKAFEYYLERAEIEGDEAERYIAFLRCAEILLEHLPSELLRISIYLARALECDKRCEATYYLAKIYYDNKAYGLAYKIVSEIVEDRVADKSHLLIDRSIQNYRLPELYARICYAVDRFNDKNKDKIKRYVQYSQRAINAPYVPPDFVLHVIKEVKELTGIELVRKPTIDGT